MSDEMNKDEIMSHFMGMIPPDSTKEIFELWSAVARLSFIIDKILPDAFMEGKMDEFVKETEKYSAEFLKKRFPYHIKDVESQNQEG